MDKQKSRQKTSYKDMSLSEIGKRGGGYSKIGRRITSSEKILPSAFLIYAIIKLSMDTNSRISMTTNKKLSILTGYSERTISRITKSLEDEKFLKKIVRCSNNYMGKFITINSYLLYEDDIDYEPHTRLFLENVNISTRTKEFVLAIQPHLISKGGRTFTFLTDIKLAELLPFSRPTIAKCIKELSIDGDWIDENGKKERFIDLNRLQLDGGLQLAIKNDTLEFANEFIKSQNCILIEENKQLKKKLKNGKRGSRK